MPRSRLYFSGAQIEVSISGTFPCDQGGEISGLLALGVPGNGSASGGSFSATWNLGSISGSLSKTGNSRHPYQISGTYYYSETVGNDLTGPIQCTGQASFSGK